MMYTLGYSGFTRDSRVARGVRSSFAKAEQTFDNIFELREGELPFSRFPLGHFGHDASAALLKNGAVVACAAEERFTRAKYSLNLAGNTLLPKNAIAYCLRAAGISIDDVEVVAHYCDFTGDAIRQRVELLRPHLAPDEIGDVERSFHGVFTQMMTAQVVREQFQSMTGALPSTFLSVRHHLAHAASAFYPSGFPEALVLTLDGTGELESSFLGVGRNGEIAELRSSPIPTSLGALYLILTVYLGFKSLGDEYKVMGLASYGDPRRFRNAFRELVTLDADGTYATPGLASRNLHDELIRALGPPRAPHAPFDARHADVAAALQATLHEAVLHTLGWARRETGLERLCLAGGVALNCTLNGVIARSGLFRDIFVQPAANDEGCSVGAALVAAARHGELQAPTAARWNHVYWGPEYSPEEISSALEAQRDRLVWDEPADIAAAAAQEIAHGKVVGWFQGRLEFGPRALGNRSILADPRDPAMKDIINEKVKRREMFRPFAPAVLEEDADVYFDMTGLNASPFMLFTVPVWEHQRRVIPAVTHVDGTARVQTVSRETNPAFWRLITELKKLTGVSVVLNTSYNVRNEPIVCSPADALSCLLSTHIDCAVLGEFLVRKRAT